MSVHVRLAVRDVGTYGGIGRYVAELVEGLRRVDGVDAEVTVIGQAVSPWAAGTRHITTPRMPLGGSLAILKLPRDRRLVHFPLHETTPFFVACSGPVVMTIHSVEPLYMPRDEIGSHLHTLPFRLLRATRRRLARVITPSAFERDRIAEHLRVPVERIDVIPHGVRHDVFRPGAGVAARKSVRDRWGLPDSYFLYVGHHQPQKNVANLIRAFASLDRDDVVLAIAGDTSACAAEYDQASRGKATVRYLGAITDDTELVDLYRGTIAFCFPSLHESFGLPALEAMASGSPVVAARGSGLQQTVGDAALLFDPRSVEELAEQLERLLDDDDERERLAAAGLARASGFTWDRSVLAHVETYRSAVA